jgi:NADPH-dependent 2,4-dienoyl-CoA reductase/sulfur reductase-like enzyme
MRVAVVGGSDAGIEAARRIRELDDSVQVTVLVADAYPNLSICGLPYWHSREVPQWQNLAHRTVADLEATGMRLLLDHCVTALDLEAKTLRFTHAGSEGVLGFDRLVLGTGAHPARPPFDGLTGPDALGPDDGVHVLHTMPDAFTLDATTEHALTTSGADEPVAVIVGAGYVGLEMAEALTTRGLRVVVLEQLGQVLPRTLDAELAARVESHLIERGVDVRCDTTVRGMHHGEEHSGDAAGGRLGVRLDDETLAADLVLVATGVRPATELAVAAGLKLGAADAIDVDRRMRTSAPEVWAAGDCVHTHHQLTRQTTYLPLGTTAHKQGRVAGENVLGAATEYAGSLGTQAVKLFDHVAAATGFRDTEARAAGHDPVTVEYVADDHKRYYPGATELRVRLTGDRGSGRLLGGQLLGAYGAEVSKRVDVLAAAIRHGDTVAGLGDIDLSYTPPLSAPWDALQQAAHAWTAAKQ